MKQLKGGIAAGLKLGSLGFKVKGLTVADVLKDAEYFREILARNKMIGFIGLNPTDEEHGELLKALYSGPDEKLAIGLIHDQCHSGKKSPESADLEDFVYQMWHVDNPFLMPVPSYTSMCMKTFTADISCGRTVLVSLVSMYDQCPDQYKTALRDVQFVHGTGHLADSTGTPAAYDALRTHPVTGETVLFWTGAETRPVQDVPWFNDFKQWVQQFLADQRNWYQWEWRQGDFIIWDNQAVIHSVTPGWKHDQRIFTRGETGLEIPFFDETTPSLLNPAFGDIVRHSGIDRDTSTGPNTDHIPLVFTKGIYGLPEWSKYFQQTTMFVYSSDGVMPEDVQRFKEAVDNDEFNVVLVDPKQSNVLERYSKRLLPGEALEGQKFLFTPNGNLEKAYKPTDDLFTDEFDEEGRWPPIKLVNALGEFHPDLRHAGHAWHYPDWFPHQPLQKRPWDWRNLSFFEYEGFPGSQPPFDYLVQFAVDTVYGCFNHLETNEERKKMIETIIDYLQFMIELGEYDVGR